MTSAPLDRTTWTSWGFPTSIRFGVGRISELAAVCSEAGISRPLLVTDPGLAGLPMVANAAQACADRGLAVEVFSNLRPNPVGANIDDGVAAFQAGDHDGVIAMGGGSALDAGKVIAFMSGQTRAIWDFEDVGDNWTRADEAGIAPVIAIPTTAGTGSEVGRAGVVTDEANHTKKIIFHPAMLPHTVICDPALTVGMPLIITVGTGIDALSHSLEALSSPAYHPMAEGIAVEGIRLVLEHLPKVVADGANLESRGHLMSAAAMGAVAFQKGLGAMHALAHPIGAHFDTHHGMTNAVLMPYVLRFNRSAITAKIERAAAVAGVDGGFDGFVERVLAMRADMAVPHTLVELGVDAGAGTTIAAAAVEDPSASGNPIAFDNDAATEIFDAACAGSIG